MIPMTLAEIADVVGGAVDGDREIVVSGPAFLDSRDPLPGGLFAAFVGENADGHDHAPGAVAGGAAAVLGSRPTGVPTVVVADAQNALQLLARHVLARLKLTAPALRVVAITGSQGKTSAKDMLSAVLATRVETVATAGSFNNELGLPLTVLRATPKTEVLVLEMGARGIGHLAELCAIAPPDISLVLNVGKAHLGEFGSRAAIAQAKGELVDALGPDGIAVLNADDPLVMGMAERCAGSVMTFGRGEADVRLGDVEVDDLGRPAFTLTYTGVTAAVRLQLLGEHQAGNAAAVAATALSVGLGLDDVAKALVGIDRLSAGRMQLGERADGLVVINDAYNANPDSMRAALETLAGIGARTGRRTVAVLGEMAELGEAAAEEHTALGRAVAELRIDEVLVVGDRAAAIHDAVVAERGEGATRRVETPAQASRWLRENVAGTDVVLVKASHVGALEPVAEELLTAGEEAR